MAAKKKRKKHKGTAPGRKSRARRAKRYTAEGRHRAAELHRKLAILGLRKRGPAITLVSDREEDRRVKAADLKLAEERGYIRGFQAAANNPDEARDSLRRGRI